MEDPSPEMTMRGAPQRVALVLIVAAQCVASDAAATSNLSLQIPSIPQSCNTCHVNGPGSARNVFGLDVEANYTGDANSGILDWATVCGLDADGDGSTNGAELGDPCCLFMPGDTVTLLAADPSDDATGSPNVCENGDAGVVDVGVDAGGVVAPDGWTCGAAAFGSGDGCDCGCGIADDDCATAALTECGFNGCPGAQVVDVLDTTHCIDDEAASLWTCGFAAYSDGAVCDCGCGVADPDCNDDARATCDASGCPVGQDVDEDNTTLCVTAEAFEDARPGWWCPADWYSGDDGCDCGCGRVDPDCPRAPSLADCSQSGCALRPEAADGDVPMSRSIDQCGPPASAPSGWTCDAQWYGAGDGCDCGCGALDDDCTDATFGSCEQSACSDGEEVDEANPTACAAPSPLSCSHDDRVGHHTASRCFGAGLLFVLGASLTRKRRRRT